MRINIPFLIGGFIIGFSFLVGYNMLNQDCNANPPQYLSCGSNTLEDAGFSKGDCIKTQRAQNNLIFPDKEEKWNCDGIDIEFYRTKCSYSPSNLTADYRFCA